MIPGIIASGARSVNTGQADPYFQNVSLLLHLDSDFSDSSSNPKTPTLVNSPQISSLSKFGSGAMQGGVGKYVTYPAGEDFRIGTGDFTIEAFVNNTSAVYFQGLLNIGSFAGGILLRIENNNKLAFWINGAEHAWTLSVTVGTYVHLAITKHRNVLTAWYGGVSLGTRLTGSDIGTGIVTIGVSAHSVGESIYGHVDEVRITKGVARYTTNFIPPTESFPNTGNVTPVLTPTIWDSYFNTSATITENGRVSTISQGNGCVATVFGATKGRWHAEVGGVTGPMAIGVCRSDILPTQDIFTTDNAIAVYDSNVYRNGVINPFPSITNYPFAVLGIEFICETGQVWFIDRTGNAYGPFQLPFLQNGQSYKIVMQAGAPGVSSVRINTGQVPVVHEASGGFSTIFGS